MHVPSCFLNASYIPGDDDGTSDVDDIEHRGYYSNRNGHNHDSDYDRKSMADRNEG